MRTTTISKKHGIFKRAIAAIMGLVMASALMIATPEKVYAASSVSGTNFTCMVQTGKKGFWGSPTIKVKNTGKKPINIVVTGDHYWKSIPGVKKNQTITVELPANKTVEVCVSGNSLAGAYYGSGKVTKGRYIQNLW